MTEQNSASGSPEPGPDTFNFEDYLEGVSTFPVFDHVAYLDQRSGAELGRVLDEVEEIAERMAALDKQIEAHVQKSSNAFVDSNLDDMRDEYEKLDQRMATLVEQRDQLTEKIKKSAITLNFQVKTPEELGTVSREAQRNFYKECKHFKGVPEDDLDHITARSRFMLVAQIVHFCTGMVLPDGREVPPPSRTGADKFLGSLISSEMMRLMESVGTGLSASQEWAVQLDAGFPGGSPDVEIVSLDSYGTEGGEVVVRSADDDADRRDDGLVRQQEQNAGRRNDDLGGGDLQGVRDSGLGRDVHQ